MLRLSLTLFGEFRVAVRGRNLVLPTRKAEALLAYLGASVGKAHTRDKLAGLLWSSSGKEQARHSLRQALSTLRGRISMPVPILLTEGETVALSPAAVGVDVVEFERLIARGTASALDRAVGVYRGEFLEGMDVDEEPFEEWLRAERARFREIIVDILARQIANHSRRGDHKAAVHASTRLLVFDPFREDIHRTLMRLYAKQGRRGDALRQYQLCVTVFQRELGVEPSEDTKQVYREMLPERRPGPLILPVTDAAETPAHSSRGAEPEAGTPSPLVGRVAELADLNRMLATAWRGRGHVTMIVGEAGIGKTRLVEDLSGSAVRRGGRVLTGRVFDAEQVLPFAPWVDILRGGLRLYHEAGIRSPNLIWRQELGRLLPELGESAHAPTNANSLRLFEAIGHFVHDLASRWPLLLILEDLHWADEMSIRLFTFLANRVQTFPLLMVATMRNEDLVEAPLLRRFLQASDTSAHVRQLNLAPLSRHETAALVRALGGRGIEPPAAVHLAEQVWFLSEGNPFLVVEIMRTPDTAEIGRRSGGLTLPERVREVVAARLERLGQPAQRLITVAATAGREFDFALLQRAAGLDESATAEGVEQLVQRRVIQPVGERFAFTHHAIRSVVYGQFPPHQRKEVHHRVAVAIEELYRDDLEPHHLALARHFSEAEVWPKALSHVWRAGMQAVGRSAHREAVVLFTQALDVLTRLPKTPPALEHGADVNLALGGALLSCGETAQALVHLREAEFLASAIGDQWRLGWVLDHFSGYFRVVGEHDRAIGAGQRALTIGVKLGDATLQTEARLQIGQAYHAAGEYCEAVSLLILNVSDAPGWEAAGAGEGSLLAALVRHRANGASLSAASRAVLIWCLAELGDFSQALSHGWEAVRGAEAAPSTDVTPRVLAYLGVGRALLARGDIKDAIPFLERCRDVEEVGDVTNSTLSIDSTLGTAYLAAERIAEAVALSTRAVDEASSMKITGGQSLRLVGLGEAVLADGRVDEARGHALQALDLARKQKERGHEAYALKLVAEIMARGGPGDLEAAFASYHQAHALATALGMRPLAASCLVGLARLHRRGGELHLARKHLADAVAMYGEMEASVALDPPELQ